jgi:glyoxylase-like metal-dependent hydrolase (beta-lactamase superfamily II)
MKRRMIIKGGMLLGLSAMLSNKKLFAFQSGKSGALSNSNFKFTLGKLELMVITDGHILFKPVQPSFAPGIPKKEVEKALEDDFLPPNQVDLAINVLVVRSGNRVILIDAGCGNTLGSTCGWLVKNLPEAGLKPEDITDVVLTHAHPDHLGGLLSKGGEPVFAKADIYLSKPENDFWLSPDPDFSKSKNHDAALKSLIINTARKTIKGVQPQLHLFNEGDTLFDCLKLKIAAGHTPGHTVITVFSDGEELVHTADLVHSEALVFAHPEWGFDGDTNFAQAALTRKNVLEDLAETRKLVFSYHLPWPGLGHVRKKGQGYEWVQKQFALPG